MGSPWSALALDGDIALIQRVQIIALNQYVARFGKTRKFLTILAQIRSIFRYIVGRPAPGLPARIDPAGRVEVSGDFRIQAEVVILHTGKGEGFLFR